MQEEKDNRLNPELRLNTRTKILMVVTLSFLALLYSQVWILAILTCISLLLYIIGKRRSSSNHSKSNFKSLLILIFSLMFIQILFRPAGTLLWHWGVVRISMEGINYGVAASFRILIIFLSAGYLLSISYYEYLMAFRSWRLPYELSFLMASVLQFLPILRREFQLVGEALTLRGIELGRLPLLKRLNAYQELVFPILARAVSSLKFRVISLEMRGFRLSNKRTALHEDHLKIIDYMVQGGLVFIITVCFYLKI